MDAAGWGEASGGLPPAIESLDPGPERAAEADPIAEVEAAVAADRAEPESETPQARPPGLSEGVPEGSVGIVLTDAAAQTLAQVLSRGRLALHRKIASGGRGTGIEQRRLDRLTEAELAIRAALLDKTLNAPNDETENP